MYVLRSPSLPVSKQPISAVLEQDTEDDEMGDVATGYGVYHGCHVFTAHGFGTDSTYPMLVLVIPMSGHVVFH